MATKTDTTLKARCQSERIRQDRLVSDNASFRKCQDARRKIEDRKIKQEYEL